MKNTLRMCVVAVLLLTALPAAAYEPLDDRWVATQRGAGPSDQRTWRAYVTNRQELRDAWERFHMRGDLPTIGFERRVAVFGGTGASSSCPLKVDSLRLNREERRITVRLYAEGGQNGCTDDWNPTTFVRSVRRADLPRGHLSIRVRQVVR